jgi:hypothetical protein
MILLRFGFDSRCALMSPPVDPVGQLVPPPHGGPTMRATEWAVNGPAGSSGHPSGLISVKPVCGLPQCGRSGPGALVGLKVSAVWAMIMGDPVRQLESPNARYQPRPQAVGWMLKLCDGFLCRRGV